MATLTQAVRELLTPAEAADRLRVSRSSIYRLVAAGTLPAVRVGASIRVRADDLDELLAKQRTAD